MRLAAENLGPSGYSRRARLRPDSRVSLVCGKITYVHRRRWPAIACLRRSPEKKTISALREEYPSSGAYGVRMIPSPRWVALEVRRAAKNISGERPSSN
jgi:hypothetical protein